MNEQIKPVAIPGEIIKTGKEYLPGEWTMRIGDNIIATKYGIIDESGKFLRVIPVSGIYTPRRSDLIVGRITDITFNGWVVDVDAPYSAFLPLAEYPKFISSEELAEYLDIGDLILCQVNKNKRKGVDLTIKGRGLGKLDDGMIIKINPNKVPRVIGKEGSMVSLIKNYTNCEITVGQNGIIWIKGKELKDELSTKKAIEFVVEKSSVNGLTEIMKEYLENGGKK
ncbi:RNA-binding protein [Candidatus Pacearchaeota archaeon CG10_big_fil_rev_8_21_14_0_10_35_13]|nr:MAG: RNA-binding protein [Candidatus Pacearchaeota archaeon CG10_big_fil_rev_8_21_14_0_10_35_13]